MRKAITPAIHACPPPGLSLCSFLFFVLVYSGAAQAQCLSTENKVGTIFTIDNTHSGLAFHAAGNIAHADNSFASAQSLEALVGEDHTQYLKATGFNFSIPSNAQICTVTVNILKRASGVSPSTTVSDEEVRIVKGGTITGLNKKSPAAWSSDLVSESYSGDAAYWGTTLTPADVNDARFGVALSAKFSSPVAAFPRAEIDLVSITIEYKLLASAPQYVEDFTTSIQKNIVSCEWTMTEEEAGSRIVLQQSDDNRQWKDVSVYSITSNARQAKYRQINRLEERGTYYYRVKVASGEGTSYSKTSRVQYSTGGELKVYPTVAHSMIYVENADPSDKIQVYSFSNQAMPISTVQVKDGLIAVRISELPKGRYLLKAGRTTRQFLKD